MSQSTTAVRCLLAAVAMIATALAIVIAAAHHTPGTTASLPPGGFGWDSAGGAQLDGISGAHYVSGIGVLPGCGGIFGWDEGGHC